MKTAPFDLAKALAGHPLVTRDGQPATCFSRSAFSQASTDLDVFKALVAGSTRHYSGEGRWIAPNDCPSWVAETDTDLPLDLLLLEPEPEPSPPTPPSIPIPEPIAKRLADLTATGLFGDTVEETALLLLKERLREIKF